MMSEASVSIDFQIHQFWRLAKTQNDLESPQIGRCRGFHYRLLIHPRGTEDTDPECSHLSVFLEAVKQPWYPDDWVFPNVRFELTVVNHKDYKQSVTSWAHWSFSNDATSRGWQKMVHHSRLTKEAGFVKEDGTVVIRGRAEPPYPSLWSRSPLFRPFRLWDTMSSPASSSANPQQQLPGKGSNAIGGWGGNLESPSTCAGEFLIPSVKGVLQFEQLPLVVLTLFLLKEFRREVLAWKPPKEEVILNSAALLMPSMSICQICSKNTNSENQPIPTTTTNTPKTQQKNIKHTKSPLTNKSKYASPCPHTPNTKHKLCEAPFPVLRALQRLFAHMQLWPSVSSILAADPLTQYSVPLRDGRMHLAETLGDAVSRLPSGSVSPQDHVPARQALELARAGMGKLANLVATPEFLSKTAVDAKGLIDVSQYAPVSSSDFEKYEKLRRPLAGHYAAAMISSCVPTNFSTSSLALMLQPCVKELQGALGLDSYDALIRLGETGESPVSYLMQVLVESIMTELSLCHVVSVRHYSMEMRKIKEKKSRQALLQDVSTNSITSSSSSNLLNEPNGACDGISSVSSLEFEEKMRFRDNKDQQIPISPNNENNNLNHFFDQSYPALKTVILSLFTFNSIHHHLDNGKTTELTSNRFSSSIFKNHLNLNPFLEKNKKKIIRNSKCTGGDIKKKENISIKDGDDNNFQTLCNDGQNSSSPSFVSDSCSISSSSCLLSSSESYLSDTDIYDGVNEDTINSNLSNKKKNYISRFNSNEENQEGNVFQFNAASIFDQITPSVINVKHAHSLPRAIENALAECASFSVWKSILQVDNMSSKVGIDNSSSSKKHSKSNQKKSFSNNTNSNINNSNSFNDYHFNPENVKFPELLFITTRDSTTPRKGELFDVPLRLDFTTAVSAARSLIINNNNSNNNNTNNSNNNPLITGNAKNMTNTHTAITNSSTAIHSWVASQLTEAIQEATIGATQRAFNVLKDSFETQNLQLSRRRRLLSSKKLKKNNTINKKLAPSSPDPENDDSDSDDEDNTIEVTVTNNGDNNDDMMRTKRQKTKQKCEKSIKKKKFDNIDDIEEQNASLVSQEIEDDKSCSSNSKESTDIEEEQQVNSHDENNPPPIPIAPREMWYSLIALFIREVPVLSDNVTGSAATNTSNPSVIPSSNNQNQQQTNLFQSHHQMNPPASVPIVSHLPPIPANISSLSTSSQHHVLLSNFCNSSPLPSENTPFISSTGLEHSTLLLRPEEEGPWYRVSGERVETLQAQVDFTEWKCHRDFYCEAAVYLSEDYIDALSAGEVDTAVDLDVLNPELMKSVLAGMGVLQRHAGVGLYSKVAPGDTSGCDFCFESHSQLDEEETGNEMHDDDSTRSTASVVSSSQLNPSNPNVKSGDLENEDSRDGQYLDLLDMASKIVHEKPSLLDTPTTPAPHPSQTALMTAAAESCTTSSHTLALALAIRRRDTVAMRRLILSFYLSLLPLHTFPVLRTLRMLPSAVKSSDCLFEGCPLPPYPTNVALARAWAISDFFLQSDPANQFAGAYACLRALIGAEVEELIARILKAIDSGSIFALLSSPNIINKLQQQHINSTTSSSIQNTSNISGQAGNEGYVLVQSAAEFFSCLPPTPLMSLLLQQHSQHQPNSKSSSVNVTSSSSDFSPRTTSHNNNPKEKTENASSKNDPLTTKIEDLFNQVTLPSDQEDPIFPIDLKAFAAPPPHEAPSPPAAVYTDPQVHEMFQQCLVESIWRSSVLCWQQLSSSLSPAGGDRSSNNKNLKSSSGQNMNRNRKFNKKHKDKSNEISGIEVISSGNSSSSISSSRKRKRQLKMNSVMNKKNINKITESPDLSAVERRRFRNVKGASSLEDSFAMIFKDAASESRVAAMAAALLTWTTNSNGINGSAISSDREFMSSITSRHQTPASKENENLSSGLWSLPLQLTRAADDAILLSSVFEEDNAVDTSNIFLDFEEGDNNGNNNTIEAFSNNNSDDDEDYEDYTMFLKANPDDELFENFRDWIVIKRLLRQHQQKSSNSNTLNNPKVKAMIKTMMMFNMNKFLKENESADTLSPSSIDPQNLLQLRIKKNRLYRRKRIARAGIRFNLPSLSKISKRIILQSSTTKKGKKPNVTDNDQDDDFIEEISCSSSQSTSSELRWSLSQGLELNSLFHVGLSVSCTSTRSNDTSRSDSDQSECGHNGAEASKNKNKRNKRKGHNEFGENKVWLLDNLQGVQVSDCILEALLLAMSWVKEDVTAISSSKRSRSPPISTGANSYWHALATANGARVNSPQMVTALSLLKEDASMAAAFKVDLLTDSQLDPLSVATVEEMLCLVENNPTFLRTCTAMPPHVLQAVIGIRQLQMRMQLLQLRAEVVLKKVDTKLGEDIEQLLMDFNDDPVHGNDDDAAMIVNDEDKSKTVKSSVLLMPRMRWIAKQFLEKFEDYEAMNNSQCNVYDENGNNQIHEGMNISDDGFSVAAMNSNASSDVQEHASDNFYYRGKSKNNNHKRRSIFSLLLSTITNQHNPQSSYDNNETDSTNAHHLLNKNILNGSNKNLSASPINHFNVDDTFIFRATFETLAALRHSKLSDFKGCDPLSTTREELCAILLLRTTAAFVLSRRVKLLYHADFNAVAERFDSGQEGLILQTVDPAALNGACVYSSGILTSHQQLEESFAVSSLISAPVLPYKSQAAMSSAACSSQSMHDSQAFYNNNNSKRASNNSDNHRSHTPHHKKKSIINRYPNFAIDEGIRSDAVCPLLLTNPVSGLDAILLECPLFLQKHPHLLLSCATDSATVQDLAAIGANRMFATPSPSRFLTNRRQFASVLGLSPCLSPSHILFQTVSSLSPAAIFALYIASVATQAVIEDAAKEPLDAIEQAIVNGQENFQMLLAQQTQQSVVLAAVAGALSCVSKSLYPAAPTILKAIILSIGCELEDGGRAAYIEAASLIRLAEPYLPIDHAAGVCVSGNTQCHDAMLPFVLLPHLHLLLERNLSRTASLPTLRTPGASPVSPLSDINVATVDTYLALRARALPPPSPISWVPGVHMLHDLLVNFVPDQFLAFSLDPFTFSPPGTPEDDVNSFRVAILLDGDLCGMEGPCIEHQISNFESITMHPNTISGSAVNATPSTIRANPGDVIFSHPSSVIPTNTSSSTASSFSTSSTTHHPLPGAPSLPLSPFRILTVRKSASVSRLVSVVRLLAVLHLERSTLSSVSSLLSSLLLNATCSAAPPPTPAAVSSSKTSSKVSKKSSAASKSKVPQPLSTLALELASRPSPVPAAARDAIMHAWPFGLKRIDSNFSPSSPPYLDASSTSRSRTRLNKRFCLLSARDMVDSLVDEMSLQMSKTPFSLSDSIVFLKGAHRPPDAVILLTAPPAPTIPVFTANNGSVVELFAASQCSAAVACSMMTSGGYPLIHPSTIDPLNVLNASVLEDSYPLFIPKWLGASCNEMVCLGAMVVDGRMSLSKSCEDTLIARIVVRCPSEALLIAQGVANWRMSISSSSTPSNNANSSAAASNPNASSFAQGSSSMSLLEYLKIKIVDDFSPRQFSHTKRLTTAVKRLPKRSTTSIILSFDASFSSTSNLTPVTSNGSSCVRSVSFAPLPLPHNFASFDYKIRCVAFNTLSMFTFEMFNLLIKQSPSLAAALTAPHTSLAIVDHISSAANSISSIFSFSQMYNMNYAFTAVCYANPFATTMSSLIFLTSAALFATGSKSFNMLRRIVASSTFFYISASQLRSKQLMEIYNTAISHAVNVLGVSTDYIIQLTAENCKILNVASPLEVVIAYATGDIQSVLQLASALRRSMTKSEASSERGDSQQGIQVSEEADDEFTKNILSSLFHIYTFMFIRIFDSFLTESVASLGVYRIDLLLGNSFNGNPLKEERNLKSSVKKTRRIASSSVSNKQEDRCGNRTEISKINFPLSHSSTTLIEALQFKQKTMNSTPMNTTTSSSSSTTASFNIQQQENNPLIQNYKKIISASEKSQILKDIPTEIKIQLCQLLDYSSNLNTSSSLTSTPGTQWINITSLITKIPLAIDWLQWRNFLKIFKRFNSINCKVENNKSEKVLPYVSSNIEAGPLVNDKQQDVSVKMNRKIDTDGNSTESLGVPIAEDNNQVMATNANNSNSIITTMNNPTVSSLDISSMSRKEKLKLLAKHKQGSLMREIQERKKKEKEMSAVSNIDNTNSAFDNNQDGDTVPSELIKNQLTQINSVTEFNKENLVSATASGSSTVPQLVDVSAAQANPVEHLSMSSHPASAKLSSAVEITNSSGVRSVVHETKLKMKQGRVRLAELKKENVAKEDALRKEKREYMERLEQEQQMAKRKVDIEREQAELARVAVQDALEKKNLALNAVGSFFILSPLVSGLKDAKLIDISQLDAKKDTIYALMVNYTHTFLKNYCNFNEGGSDWSLSFTDPSGIFVYLPIVAKILLSQRRNHLPPIIAVEHLFEKVSSLSNDEIYEKYQQFDGDVAQVRKYFVSRLQSLPDSSIVDLKSKWSQWDASDHAAAAERLVSNVLVDITHCIYIRYDNKFKEHRQNLVITDPQTDKYLEEFLTILASFVENLMDSLSSDERQNLAMGRSTQVILERCFPSCLFPKFNMLTPSAMSKLKFPEQIILNDNRIVIHRWDKTLLASEVLSILLNEIHLSAPSISLILLVISIVNHSKFSRPTSMLSRKTVVQILMSLTINSSLLQSATQGSYSLINLEDSHLISSVVEMSKMLLNNQSGDDERENEMFKSEQAVTINNASADIQLVAIAVCFVMLSAFDDDALVKIADQPAQVKAFDIVHSQLIEGISASAMNFRSQIINTDSDNSQALTSRALNINVWNVIISLSKIVSKKVKNILPNVENHMLNNCASGDLEKFILFNLDNAHDNVAVVYDLEVQNLKLHSDVDKLVNNNVAVNLESVEDISQLKIATSDFVEMPLEPMEINFLQSSPVLTSKSTHPPPSVILPVSPYMATNIKVNIDPTNIVNEIDFKNSSQSNNEDKKDALHLLSTNDATQKVIIPSGWSFISSPMPLPVHLQFKPSNSLNANVVRLSHLPPETKVENISDFFISITLKSSLLQCHDLLDAAFISLSWKDDLLNIPSEDCNKQQHQHDTNDLMSLNLDLVFASATEAAWFISCAVDSDELETLFRGRIRNGLSTNIVYLSEDFYEVVGLMIGEFVTIGPASTC